MASSHCRGSVQRIPGSVHLMLDIWFLHKGEEGWSLKNGDSCQESILMIRWYYVHTYIYTVKIMFLTRAVTLFTQKSLQSSMSGHEDYQWLNVCSVCCVNYRPSAVKWTVTLDYLAAMAAARLLLLLPDLFPNYLLLFPLLLLLVPIWDPHLPPPSSHSPSYCFSFSSLTSSSSSLTFPLLCYSLISHSPISSLTTYTCSLSSF